MGSVHHWSTRAWGLSKMLDTRVSLVIQQGPPIRLFPLALGSTMGRLAPESAGGQDPELLLVMIFQDVVVQT